MLCSIAAAVAVVRSRVSLRRRGGGLDREAIGCETVSLRLTDPRFYHLDTCLCPLDGGWLLYYPAAFDREAQEKIRALLPHEKRFEVGEADALDFACNAVSLGRHVILNHASDALQSMLTARGILPILTAAVGVPEIGRRSQVPDAQAGRGVRQRYRPAADAGRKFIRPQIIFRQPIKANREIRLARAFL